MELVKYVALGLVTLLALGLSVVFKRWVSKDTLTPNLRRPYLFECNLRKDVYIDKNGVFLDRTPEQIMEEERSSGHWDE